jgi:hypothetical protein
MPILGIIASSKLTGEVGDYESIASFTVSSATSTITFSGIPSTYKHLQLRSINLSDGQDNNIILRFNTDAGNNYSEHALVAQGTTLQAYATTPSSYCSAGYTANATFPSPSICDILDYANTNKNKTIRAFGGSNRNGALSYITYQSSAWMNTAAINRIDVIHGNIASGKVWNTHTSFALYGIKG